MTIRAHFDGSVIVPDEPVQLPIGQPLEVVVRGLPGAEEHRPAPNEAMLAAIRKLEEIQRGMNPTPGGDTLADIREARAGAMYGYKLEQ
jgi:hypothetical protein